MTPDLGWRADVYRGTARDDERWRPPYPPDFFEDLRRRLPVSGSGRLLDLACGTGQIAFALAANFDEIVAVDQEVESLAVGSEKARMSGIGNISWLAGSAESVALDGAF